MPKFTLVRNKSGEEIVFEIALAYMLDDLRELVESMKPQTKQEFFSLYELAYEDDLGELCPLSVPQPIYA